ncbi:PREDICTED: uncharacterized protein LOC104595947 [Nelumbo nucifera]|nr:PREDICTED: uncharacterized protein LOC104595947 [Nelumbo nucifera]
MKNSQDIHNQWAFSSEDLEDRLALTLSPPSARPRPPPPLLPLPLQPALHQPRPQLQPTKSPEPMISPPPPHHPFYIPTLVTGPPTPTQARQELVPSRPLRTRRNPPKVRRSGNSEVITPPYPWATNHRATVHSLHNLLSMGIHTIFGEVKCKKCEHQYEMEFQLESKFIEVASFIATKKSTMHDRAPREWTHPLLPTCRYCEQVNSAKPIIDRKKKMINWLFLLLGQMLGCCSLEQLKYFCKHTKNHRTGAKDRVLYLTYLGLCKQLDHTGPFDR